MHVSGAGASKGVRSVSAVKYKPYLSREWVENTHSQVVISVTQDESPSCTRSGKLNLVRSKTQGEISGSVQQMALCVQSQHGCRCHVSGDRNSLVITHACNITSAAICF